MNKKILATLILLNYFGLSAQTVESIRFVYGGEEPKPRGTLLICIGKLIKPTDRGRIDSIFGRSVKTDETTFHFIKMYLQQNGYTVKNIGEIIDTIKHQIIDGQSYYTIICSDGLQLYLREPAMRDFFCKLEEGLQVNELDKAVIKELKRE